MKRALTIAAAAGLALAAISGSALAKNPWAGTIAASCHGDKNANTAQTPDENGKKGIGYGRNGPPAPGAVAEARAEAREAIDSGNPAISLQGIAVLFDRRCSDLLP